MNNSKYLKKIIAIAIITSGLSMTTTAETDNGHTKDVHRHVETIEQMSKNTQEVWGVGVVNKVMADHNMLNISHEPIQELNWPKMRMNFTTQEWINLSDLKLGQQVVFKLIVNEDNSYIIKDIIYKKE